MYISDMKDPSLNRLPDMALRGAGILFAILILMGCQTLVSKEFPAADWQYQVKTDKVGERRGVQWGYLFYKGRELKSYFNTIVLDQTRYDFTINTEKSQYGGFWINEEHQTPIAANTQGIKAEEFKRGWYLASLDQKKADTPGDWVWVKRENIEAYVDPSKIYSLVGKYKISPILDGDEDSSPFQLRMGFGFRRRI
jgi:hypothetical protein